MALFRRFLYRNPPDRLLKVVEHVYVFDCCFSTNVMDEDDYKTYMGNIATKLHDYYPHSSFMVFDFREGDQIRSQISDILSQYNMTVMEYPRQFENYPLLSLEMVHHFLKSCESWLSLDGQQNVILMNCERGGWPTLAFMLAGLVLYMKQYNIGEQKTLENMYKEAPMEIIQLLTPLNPQSSQLRYLQYVSRRKVGSEWPPPDIPLSLDCVILQSLPLFEGGKVCRPLIRVCGRDPLSRSTARSKSTKQIFSSLKNNQQPSRRFSELDDIFFKVDIYCRVQGDVVLECIHLCDDLVSEELVFKVMFHTGFIRSNHLMLGCDDVDCSWDLKGEFPKEFRTEVIFSYIDTVSTTIDAERVGRDEEYFEVEEIPSNKLGRKDSWKEDFDPHNFQDCESDYEEQNFGEEHGWNAENFISLDDLKLKRDDAVIVKENIVVESGGKKHGYKANKNISIHGVKDNAHDDGNHKKVVDIKGGDDYIPKVKDINLNPNRHGDEKMVNSTTKVISTLKNKEANMRATNDKDNDHNSNGRLLEDVYEGRQDGKEIVAYRGFEHKIPQARLSTMDSFGLKHEKQPQAMNKKSPGFSLKSAFGSPFPKSIKKKGALAAEVKHKLVDHKWIPSNAGSFTSAMPIFNSSSRATAPTTTIRSQTIDSSSGNSLKTCSPHDDAEALNDQRNLPIKDVKMIKRSESVENLSFSTITGNTTPFHHGSN